MIIIIFLIAHWYTSLFCQTFFLHRYSAHQMFSMSKGWEKLFFIITWLCQGSSYLSAYAYGILHRMHHAYADTEKDPHSPKYDSSIMTMMWRTRHIYNQIFFKEITQNEIFTKNIPEWRSFDKFASNNFVRVLWIIIYTLFYYQFATHWWMFALIPIHILMGPIHGVIINWFAHKYGYVNFDVADTSKNLLPFDFLMMGEGYHNNHHKHGNNPNFGYRWYEIDVSYLIISVLSFLRVIKLT